LKRRGLPTREETERVKVAGCPCLSRSQILCIFSMPASDSPIKTQLD
jgi:hypothetical protein